jgi:hypothetical protein
MRHGMEKDRQGMSAFFLVAGSAGTGLIAGTAYFAAMKLSVRLFVAGAGAARQFLLSLARLAGIVLVFAAAAHFGAAPLIAAFCGFLLARHLAMRSG